MRFIEKMSFHYWETGLDEYLQNNAEVILSLPIKSYCFGSTDGSPIALTKKWYYQNGKNNETSNEYRSETS